MFIEKFYSKIFGSVQSKIINFITTLTSNDKCKVHIKTLIKYFTLTEIQFRTCFHDQRSYNKWVTHNHKVLFQYFSQLEAHFWNSVRNLTSHKKCNVPITNFLSDILFNSMHSFRLGYISEDHITNELVIKLIFYSNIILNPKKNSFLYYIIEDYLRNKKRVSNFY
jgi:hypothetical protein